MSLLEGTVELQNLISLLTEAGECRELRMGYERHT